MFVCYYLNLTQESIIINNYYYCLGKSLVIYRLISILWSRWNNINSSPNLSSIIKTCWESLAWRSSLSVILPFPYIWKVVGGQICAISKLTSILEWALLVIIIVLLQTKEFIKMCIDNGVYDFDTAYM